MLATLVIGLREGLEAALIVGIIAAFLRRAGKPLRAMWIGVSAAILLSILVGVTLELISADLPQAQQEGMETVIGFVAVLFVTGMIGWMNTHARSMRSDLEQSAQHALRDGTAWALVGMAFLAVLKEGFETSVFLLAAFQSSTNAATAGAGALIGVAIAVGIGIGIYRGGVKINLGRFFRITGLFLVLVAAGLVLNGLRTAHEAGWVQIGQQTTVDLSWLAPRGSVQAALLTGVLGIPADPRLIEVLGWFAYLVPVLLYLLWPVAKRPTIAQLPRLWFGMAAVLGIAAIVLAVAVPLPGAYSPGSAPVNAADGARAGSASLTKTSAGYQLTARGTTTALASGESAADHHEGVSTRMWKQTTALGTASLPTTLTLTRLIELSGGRVPIGVNASQNPGPFTAAWTSTSTVNVWETSGVLLDASFRPTTTLVISGGGLPASRTLSITPATAPSAWSIDSAYVSKTLTGLSAGAYDRAELLLWKLYLPIALALAALVLVGNALRVRLRARKRAMRARVEADKRDTAGATTAVASAPANA